MKKILGIVALLLAIAGARADTKDPISKVLPENYGEVFFFRQESNGSLNILLSTIRCEDWPRVVLVGGEAGGVYLKEGSYHLQVFSPEPYVHESSATACRSAVLRVQVRKGEKVIVEVIPEILDEKRTAKFHWTLSEQKG
jgi:hypothetical protein